MSSLPTAKPSELQKRGEHTSRRREKQETQKEETNSFTLNETKGLQHLRESKLRWRTKQGDTLYKPSSPRNSTGGERKSRIGLDHDW